jgi:hypothetical protein
LHRLDRRHDVIGVDPMVDWSSLRSARRFWVHERSATNPWPCDAPRAMVQAVSDYALQVLAYAKLDAKHVASAQRALAPIDAFRAAASKRGSGSAVGDGDDYELPEGAPAPDDPLPVVAEE